MIEQTKKRKKYNKPMMQVIRLDRDISIMMVSDPPQDPGKSRPVEPSGPPREDPFSSPFR